MAAGTGPLKEDSGDRSIYVGRTAWTGETEQNREGKSGHDSNARIAVSGEPWTRLFGQESLHRRAG
jgi:hypothetical protein